MTLWTFHVARGSASVTVIVAGRGLVTTVRALDRCTSAQTGGLETLLALAGNALFHWKVFRITQWNLLFIFNILGCYYIFTRH